MIKSDKTPPKPDIVTSSKEYFAEVVGEAFRECKVHSSMNVKSYIIELLNFYLHTENLFSDNQNQQGKRGQETLAEMYLKAMNTQPPASTELLKKLADSSLYISGFFGDSLKRKVVDVDYYADIGGSAYRQLAHLTTGGVNAEIYQEISLRFLEYVDVLTCVSQKSFFSNSDDLLRLYDRYVLTGSKQAEEKLIEKGLYTPSPYAKKLMKQ